MSPKVHWGPVSVWHHRVLGGFWALCGLVMATNTAIDLVQNGLRTDTSIVIMVALTYVIIGIPFMFGRQWARRTMGALVVIAALVFLDVMMASHGEMNLPEISARVVAAVAGYTLLFLVISAAWHSEWLP